MAGPFEDAGDRLIQGAMAGLFQAAVDIMYESQLIVPVDTATLKRSARVLEPVNEGTAVVCELGYGYGEEINPKTGMRAAGYAIPVHERTEVRHAPPTSAKYLETPMLAYADRLDVTVGAWITRAAKDENGNLHTWLEQIHGPSQAVGGTGPLG